MMIYTPPSKGIIPTAMDFIVKSLQGEDGYVPQRAGLAATDLADWIHGSNVDVGWWTDLKTGQPKERNVGELLMLFCTEIDEAQDGHEQGLMDEHLPRRKSAEVELADVVIRVLDTAGRYCPFFQNYVETAVRNVRLLNHPISQFYGTSVSAAFGNGYKITAKAYEAYRKENEAGFGAGLAALLVWAVQMSLWLRFDLPLAVEEKFFYNRQRADHKIEARKADGGKKT